MDLNIVKRLPKTAINACLFVFLFEDGRLKGQSRKLNTENNDLIKNLYTSKDFQGRADQTLLLHAPAGTCCERVLLIGVGNRSNADADAWFKACSAASELLRTTPTSAVLSDCLDVVSITGMSQAQMTMILTREVECAQYKFTLHPSQEPIAAHTTVESISLSCDTSQMTAVKLAAQQGVSTANGMTMARNLGNLAPNICTPTYLADQAKAFCDRFDNFTAEILDEDMMSELGMGALLSVSTGSGQPAKLIVMRYQGKKRAGSPVVLVGKGVTFDTGGISIKPSESMDEMKFDMCGAASVFGVMQTVGELQPELNVIGVVAAAENMPDGYATRPGDVVTSMSGKTIEILNTDAEGRLVLCDALTFVHRYKPAVVIDIATLTGAAVVALGHHRSAVFGNDQATIDALYEAGVASNDLTWPMPMGSDYQAQLDSNFADLANIGGRAAGAVTAACFLSEFAQELRWAHLDIAGVAWKSGKQKGATGRPVPLLIQYLLPEPAAT